MTGHKKASVFKSPPLPPLLREADVCKLLGVHRSTIWRRMKVSDFPPPIRIGVRSLRWRVVDLEKWVAARPTVTNSCVESMNRGRRQ